MRWSAGRGWRSCESWWRFPYALDVQLRRDAGLTHFEYDVLAMVSLEGDGGLALAVLAKRMNSSPSRLSHVLKRLEHKGFLERAPMPNDGRITLAMLTDAGRAATGAAAPGHVREVRRLIFDRLSREQITALGEICAALGPSESERCQSHDNETDC